MFTRDLPKGRPSVNRSVLIVSCALAILAVALLALTGSIFGIVSLSSVVPGFPEMKPNTALAFGFVGAGLIGFAGKGTSAGWRLSTGRIFGVLVCLFGAVTLAEYITGWNSGFDTFLSSIIDFGSENQLPGRMAPQSALSFFAVGLSLFTLGARRLSRISEVFAWIVATVTFAAVLGHLYGAEELYGISKYNSMALHTTFLFCVSACGLFAANKDGHTVKLLMSDSLGGSAARKLLPAVILIPTAVGWLRVIGQEHHLYDTGFGASLTIFACVVIMCGIVISFSGKMHRIDSRQKLFEGKLAEKEKRYRELFDYGQSMICIHNIEGVIMTVNPAALNSLGYTNEEVVGRNIRDFMPEEVRQQFAGYLRQIRYEGISDGAFALTAKNGKRVIWKYQSIVVAEPGKTPYVLGNAQDITKLLEAKDELRNLSLTDDLTGLYNRRGFLTMVEQQIKLERHAGTARGLTLMFADMDGLKEINDKFGHEAGSEAIIALANIMRSVLRDADLIARWGGDEFVILTVGTQPGHGEMMVKRILKKVDAYNLASGKPFELACSIGVATVPLGGEGTFESVLDTADRAMYAEKKRRKAHRKDKCAIDLHTGSCFGRPYTSIDIKASRPSFGPVIERL